VAGARIDIFEMTDGGYGGAGNSGYTTGSDGRCVIVDAPDGTLGAWALADGFMTRSNDPVAATRDATERNLWRVEVRLEPAFVVSGRLLHADGTPAPDIQLEIWNAERSWCSVGQQSDRAGAFRITGVPAGTFDLCTRPAERIATVTAGASDVVVRLDDGPSANACTLSFVGPDGAPVPKGDVAFSCPPGGGLRAWFHDAKQAVESRYYAGGDVVIAVSQAHDAKFERLPLGAAIFVVPAPIPVAIEVRFPPERVAAGRVVDPDGRGVARVSLRARFDERGISDEVSAATTSSDGTFELRQLGDGRFRVDVDPPPDLVSPAPFDIRGGQRDVVVTLSAAAVGVVTVLDGDAHPVRGAVISVRATKTEDHEREPRLLTQVVTGADGRARVNGIVPGTECAISVEGPANRDDLANWSASPWTPHDAEVRLERAIPIRGVVVNAAGQGVPHATVFVATDAGDPAEVQADDTGRFVIPRLRRGETRRLCGGGSFAYIVPKSPQWTAAAAGGEDVRLVAQGSE
jgi:hypothetical protein